MKDEEIIKDIQYARKELRKQYFYIDNLLEELKIRVDEVEDV